MAKSLFEFFQWSNPKSSALSEEQTFFDENASLFNEPLSRYDDPTSLFGLIRANIVLLSLKNREYLFHFIDRLSEENLHEEKTRDAIFERLPYFLFKGKRIYVPTFSPQVNEKLYETPWVFKAFPYNALMKDRNSCLHYPFDTYGNLPFSSLFSRLVRLDVQKAPSSVFYHMGFTTLFVIDDQGNLEQEIPLKDEGLKSWPPEDLFGKLVLVMEDYFRMDKIAFLDHLEEYQLISPTFHDDAMSEILARQKKQEKRLLK